MAHVGLVKTLPRLKNCATTASQSRAQKESPLFHSFALIFSNARLRICTLGLFLSGVTFSATMPYQSLVGVDLLRMSNDWYSVLVFATAVSSLLIGVTIGVASDRFKNRYALIPPTALMGVVGFGLVFIYPTVSTFFFAHLLPIPIAGSLYSLFFAAARAETNQLPSYERDSVTSTIRALFAISWVVVPTVMGVLLSLGSSTYVVYLIAACACLANACLFAFYGLGKRAKPAEPAATVDAPHPPHSSLWDVISWVLLWRLVLIGLIVSAHKLQGILYALVITGTAGGAERDVGLYAGLVAAAEIPLMLVWGHLLKWISKSTALGIGAIFYAGYLGLLSQAHSMAAIYASIPLNAIGASVILSVTISYLQGIFEHRPGLSTSLSYVTSLIAMAISSLIFSATTLHLGYSEASMLGAALVLLGGVGLVLTERYLPKWSRVQ